MDAALQLIIDNPGSSFAVIMNLILIESLLSVDNAAVLATMVMDLPKEQRDKALKYGIIGAYVFRGLCLLFAAFLIQVWWLKPLGGMYLLWLVADQFKDSLKIGEKGSTIFRIITLVTFLAFVRTESYGNIMAGANAVASWFGVEQSLNVQFDFYNWLVLPILVLYIIYLVYSAIKLQTDADDDGEINKSNNQVYQFFFKKIGLFWSTVILVEIMDLAFSIDNVFAAVAFSNNIILVWTGVFIGILAMRFVAQAFVRLMEKFPFLETAAFLVIALLGLKLGFSLYEHYLPNAPISVFMSSHTAEWATSILTVAIFVVPILTNVIFDYPKKSVLS